MKTSLVLLGWALALSTLVWGAFYVRYPEAPPSRDETMVIMAVALALAAAGRALARRIPRTKGSHDRDRPGARRAPGRRRRRARRRGR